MVTAAETGCLGTRGGLRSRVAPVPPPSQGSCPTAIAPRGGGSPAPRPALRGVQPLTAGSQGRPTRSPAPHAAGAGGDPRGGGGSGRVPHPAGRGRTHPPVGDRPVPSRRRPLAAARPRAAPAAPRGPAQTPHRRRPSVSIHPRAQPRLRPCTCARSPLRWSPRPLPGTGKAHSQDCRAGREGRQRGGPTAPVRRWESSVSPPGRLSRARPAGSEAPPGSVPGQTVPTLPRHRAAQPAAAPTCSCPRTRSKIPRASITPAPLPALRVTL